jgi:hypothetical protein
MARIIGLPASPDLAARMHYRGLINEPAFYQALKEGNTRAEWGPFLLDGFRQIPTAHEGIEGHLRGWETEAEMYARTAAHGMSQADTDLLYKISGRPVTVHEVVLGLARGAVYPSTYEDVPEPYRKAIQESNIRPEWASIHYHSRFTYPSAFVLRSLAQAGDLGNAQAVEQILLELGWKPSLAAQVSAKWVPIAAVALDPHVKKAQGTLFTEAHKAYVKNGIDVPQLAPAFTALGIAADAQAEIVALWDLEKQLASDVPPPTSTVT